ncbi:hypothetical protein BKA82DRAFT_4149545 [Pisolithus tinctorius]|nr:hypothetical protein BKA82DRAFT_4149545 [Pisolithus tinctorius]
MSSNMMATPGYTSTLPGTQVTSGSETSYLYPYHPPAVAKSLIKLAQALVNPRGKGIYATDETIDSIESRLASAEGIVGKLYTDAEKRERRRRFRQCLYESLPTDYISGVILYHETLLDFQMGPVLSNRGIIPGVRADTNAHPLPISPSEPATQGLDDLLPRLQAAARACLARFAAISQQAGLVPIVEPDVDFAEDASLKPHMIYARCAAYGVLLEGSLIKPSHPSRANTSVETIGLAAATVLARSLPVAVAGVVFLSGGLSDSDSVQYLNAVNTIVNGAPSESPLCLSRLPNLSFSFGRGLQGSAMQKWVKGNEAGAKAAFEERAKACFLAARGEL